MTCEKWVAAVSALALSGIVSASAAAPSPSCTSDESIEVCVVSAAIGTADNPVFVDVFLSLRITNKTPGPLFLLIGNDMSFAPANAPSLTPANSNDIQVSGMMLCRNACAEVAEPRFTTFTPNRPLLVQIRYPAIVSSDAKRMVQSATTASFSATLGVKEGEKRRFIPLPTTEFRFGNGLIKQ